MRIETAPMRTAEPPTRRSPMHQTDWLPPPPATIRIASLQTGRLLAFLLGLGTRLQVNVVGYLPFSELALLLLFPFNFSRALSPANLRKTGWMVPLCFVWLASAIFTDVYRGTDWSLAARGIGRALIYCIAIPQMLAFFSGDAYRKVVWFTVGSIPSFLLSQFIFRGGVIEGRERVYGRAILDFATYWNGVLGLCILLSLLLWYHRSRLLAHALAWSTGMLDIAFGARSAGAMFLIGSVLCIGKRRIGGSLVSRDIFTLAFRVTVASLTLAGAMYGIYLFYTDAAASGRLGAAAQKKYLSQSSSRLGLLLGGREPVVAGAIAAIESPFIGYGSWPIDTQGFYLRACELSGRVPDKTFYRLGYPLIPTHSHVLCAWVENGIGGLLFWVYVILFYARLILRPMKDEKRLGLYFAVAVVTWIWHILFSPVAARIEQSIFIALVANDAYGVTLDAARRSLYALRRNA